MNGSRSNKSASVAITDMALQALKNRRKHLNTARSIWKKHLERTESELIELNAQIARMEGQPPTPKAAPVGKGDAESTLSAASDSHDSQENVAFSLNY